MKKQVFKVKIPFEVGDYIKFKKASEERIMKITDIITESSYVRGSTKVKLELEGWYILDLSRHAVTGIEKYDKCPNGAQ